MRAAPAASAGRSVWTQHDLRRQQSSAGPVVSLTIPSGVLVNGSYELKLKGVVNPQQVEDVRYYYFNVRAR